MVLSDEIRNEIIRNFNQDHGEDLLDPQKCLEILEKYTNVVKVLEEKLSLSNPDATIAKTLHNVRSTIENVDKLIAKSKSLQCEIKGHLCESNEVKEKVEGYVEDLDALGCSLQYLKIILRFDKLSADLQKEITGKDDEQCVTIFANLCEICRHLHDSPAVHLFNYLMQVLLHWRQVLKEKLSKDFDEILKAIKWPFVNANFNLQTPHEASIQKLQIIVEHLFQIDLPEELAVPSTSDFPTLSLPMQLLVRPLKKRFLYHFYGSRQTNRIDKPEWYFTQILSWIRDHGDFVEKWVQPVADKMGLYQVDAKMELMSGLVKIAVEKLSSDLPQMQYDDYTFSHCIDEALGFDKELRESYQYPQSLPSILIVLTQPQVFIKWLAMEKKYAVEKMDVMLSEANRDAFEPIAAEIEDFNVNNCADMFVTLLQTIMERYEVLPQPGHRLQFFDLQLELLDDFRVRLLQIANAQEGNIVESTIPMIINTVFYIEHILCDWGSVLHYLNLYYYKSQMEHRDNATTSYDADIETETVFADTISLYRRMKDELLSLLSKSVVSEAQMCSRNYRHEVWSAMKVQRDFRSLSLTPSSCPIFEILAMRLHQLRKALATKMFAITWKSIAQQLDAYFFENLILDSKFNEGGAQQVKYDITRNLFPLFADYTEKPEAYFPQLNDSCILLNIAKGSALLLRETLRALEGATGVEDTRGRTLKEMGVGCLTPQLAVTVLNRRWDITFNRLELD